MSTETNPLVVEGTPSQTVQQPQASPEQVLRYNLGLIEQFCADNKFSFSLTSNTDYDARKVNYILEISHLTK